MKCISLLQDVENLKQTRSPDAKAQITEKISHFFNEGLFEESEMKVAEEVLRLLAMDTERKVQLALATTLKSNPNLPRDVALTLAKGVEEVSLPILEFSKVLTDDDLVEIIKSTKEVARWKAIARREKVAEPVSSALIDTKSGETIKVLLNNKGANISEASMDQLLENFSNSDNIMEILVRRGRLPLAIAAKMITKVSDNLQKELKAKYPASVKASATMKTTVDRAVSQSSTEARERIIVDFLSNKTRDTDARDLVEHLMDVGSLTPSIVLRGLCKGDLPFFVHGIAKLSGIGVDNARKLVLDKSGVGFAKVYERAGLPKTMYESIKVIMKFVLDEIEKGTITKDGYAERIVARIIDGGYDNLLTSMPYLMVLINSPLTTEPLQ